MIPGVLAQGASSPTSDPFWSDVILLSGFDGADGATALVSEDAAARTFTFDGGLLKNTEKVFGPTSLYLAGGSSIVTLPDSSDWSFGGGDFTIEYRARCYDFSAEQFSGMIAQRSNVSGNVGWLLTYDATNHQVQFYWSTDGTYGTLGSIVGGITLAQDTWYAFAVSYDGTTMRLFVNGAVIGTTSVSSLVIADVTHTLDIGQSNDNGTQRWRGYIDELRITKACRYTGAYTPATAAFPRS